MKKNPFIGGQLLTMRVIIPLVDALQVPSTWGRQRSPHTSLKGKMTSS